MKIIFTKNFNLLGFFCLALTCVQAQTVQWSFNATNTAVLSSPRAADLNSDGVKDIVIGGGVDGFPKANGIMAINGATGASLWTAPCQNEMFGSAVFNDITGDLIPDVFIAGRGDQLYAFNGQTGATIWSYVTPNLITDTILNFYNPQLIPDVDSDGKMDLLLSHGGQHHKPASDLNRRSGRLKIISGATGLILHQAYVPDGKETYCSPVLADFDKTGTISGSWIVYGTGGETAAGSLWAVKLSDLLADDISGSIELVQGNGKGFIAPASIADINKDGYLDVIGQSYDGSITGYDFKNSNQLWKVDLGGCESSSTVAIGNFTGDFTPDAFALVNKGLYPNYTSHSYILIDGAKGTYTEYPVSDMAHASTSAVDLNGDGRDEVIASLNKSYTSGLDFKNEIKVYNFQANTLTDLITPQFYGINLSSTAWIGDMDSDSKIDVVFAFRADSSFNDGDMGIYVKRVELTSNVPVTGIAWGQYMGTSFNGNYTDNRSFCGAVNVSRTVNQPSCNSTADGIIDITVSGGVAPYTYTWSNNAVGQDLSSILPGLYSVAVVDANACMDTAYINVASPFDLNFTITDNSCTADLNGVINLSGSPGTTVFTLAGSNAGTIVHPGQLTNKASGVYYYTFNSGTGCIVNDSVDVGPVIRVNFVKTLESSPGANDGVLVASPSGVAGPYTYQWDGSASLTGNTLSGLSNGSTHTVMVTGSNPCQTGTATVMLNSGTTGVFGSASHSLSGITIYPNPAAEMTMVETDKNLISSFELELFDAMSRLVRHYSNSDGSKLQIDKENLSPGLYHAIIRHSKGTDSFKIIFTE